MTDFTGVGDGDLHAVVRGYTNGFSTTFMDNPPTCFAPLSIQEDDFVFTSSPDLFETSTVLDELEELYKPFYPILNPLSQQNVLSSSISASREETKPENESFSGSPVVAAAATPPAVKYKRRKTKHKRVVLQVTAEGLSSDIWAWRKYGQKPIKGSPYPRSYYRCSSSKGCLARKQVERSYLDPEMFVITYTAEHCHGQPTRRNSLAGTTRHRFSPPKSSTTGDLDAPIPKDSPCSPISSAALSPPTPLLATIEDEFSKQAIKKESTEEEEEEEQQIAEGSERNRLVICDMILNDDFLAGFDEFDGLTSDLAYNGAWWEQFPISFPC